MSLANVRQMLNRQMGATTGRRVQSANTLGFHPAASVPMESFEPAITPKTPVEEMMFASEPVNGGPQAPAPFSGPSAVETGLISPETGKTIDDAMMGTFGFNRGKGGEWGMNPLGLLANTVPFSGRLLGQTLATGAKYANTKLGDPVGKAKGKLYEMYSQAKANLTGFDNPIQAAEYSLSTTPVTNPITGLPVGFTVGDATTGNFGSGTSPSGFGGYEGAMLGGRGFDAGLADIDVGAASSGYGF